MLLLFNYLDKNIKKTPNLKKELVYKAVFGKLKKLNESKLTQLRYRLYRFIEDQIVTDQIMGSNENKEHLIQKELILLDYFRDKVVPENKNSVEGINRLVENKMADVENLVKTTKVKDIYYHLNLYRLSNYLYYNLSTAIRGEGKLYLEQLMKNLDIFYCLAKLRYSFEMIQREKINNENISIFFFDKMHEFSKSIDFIEFPLVSIYRLIADLSSELDKEKIIELKNKLLENAEVLGKVEIMNSLTLLLNFMMQINREKNINMAFEEYQVYQFILLNKIYITNGEIRPQFLINCSVNFVSVGKSEEIGKMLDVYSEHIPKHYKEKTTKLCSAYQLFGSSDFVKCCYLLYKQSFLPFNLQAKSLLLKSLYEVEFVLKEPIKISFFDVFENYKRFIRRKKKQMNQNFYQATMNFADCLLKLTNNTQREIIESYINNLEYLVERKWLIEKNKKK